VRPASHILPGMIVGLSVAVLLLPGVLLSSDPMPLWAQQDPAAAQATGTQVEQCQACIAAVESARRALRALRAELHKPQPGWNDVAELNSRLAAEVRVMFAEQRKLEAALRPEQRPVFASDLEQFQRLQKSLAASLAAVDHLLAAEQPALPRLQTEARQMERLILEWKMRQEAFAGRMHGGSR
jgi:hypothetical protein